MGTSRARSAVKSQARQESRDRSQHLLLGLSASGLNSSLSWFTGQAAVRQERGVHGVPLPYRHHFVMADFGAKATAIETCSATDPDIPRGYDRGDASRISASSSDHLGPM